MILWRQTSILAISMLILVGAALFVRGTDVGAAPYGATVYQGLVAVTTGNPGDSLLEIGNAGQQIASTGALYLRPVSLAAASSIRFEKLVGGATRLHAPGGVCFGTALCQDTWPTGSGTSYWDLISNQYLRPKAGYGALAFTKTSGDHASLEVNAQSTDAALAITSVPVSGTAAEFSGGFYVNNDVYVDARPASGDEILAVDTLDGTPYRVWHAGNDGHTSTRTGLDASKLDGFEISFRTVPAAQLFAANCGSDLGPETPDANCFCGDFWTRLGSSGGPEIRCVRLQ